jgi:hypothetical protein
MRNEAEFTIIRAGRICCPDTIRAREVLLTAFYTRGG